MNEIGVKKKELAKTATMAAEPAYMREYFRDITKARALVEDMTGEAFVNKIREKYHYPEGEAECIRTVAASMKERILRDAQVSFLPEHDGARDGSEGYINGINRNARSVIGKANNEPDKKEKDKITGDRSKKEKNERYSLGEMASENHAAEKLVRIVITLGAGIDELQDAYTGKQMLSECYMVEVIAGEILLMSYPVCNQRIREIFGRNVARYLFVGSTEVFPMERLPGLLKDSGLPVTCNQSFYMIPKKSVAFYAVLTENEQVVCEGICVGCQSLNCPNRMEEKENHFGRAADLAGVALNYGYARIFNLV